MMTVTELRAFQREHAEAERADGAPMFMNIPDRWFEEPGPFFRCVNGHVSRTILKSEERGDLCLAARCQQAVVLTFPEDVEDV